MPKCNNSSRIENTADEIKSESKRELRYTDEFIPMYNPVRFDDDRFSGFVDFEPDLETPPGIGGVMPVYALPPNSEGKGKN